MKIFVFLVALTGFTLSKEHALSVITNNHLPKEKAELFLRYESDSVISEFGIRHGEDEYLYAIEDLIPGISLVELAGYKVITIGDVIADPKKGGYITLNYLTNGISKKYKKIKLYLLPHFGKHSLFNQTKKMRVHTMFGKVRKILGQPVGIKEIIFNPNKRTNLPYNNHLGQLL